mmetsp:Transcript_54242/g.109100  ORF Transcript_54242/g.109100 Transcript_54242/m.109100 type:complete len:568 (-) Transcript_54242:338-2041(-)
MGANRHHHTLHLSVARRVWVEASERGLEVVVGEVHSQLPQRREQGRGRQSGALPHKRRQLRTPRGAQGIADLAPRHFRIAVALGVLQEGLGVDLALVGAVEASEQHGQVLVAQADGERLKELHELRVRDDAFASIVKSRHGLGKCHAFLRQNAFDPCEHRVRGERHLVVHHFCELVGVHHSVDARAQLHQKQQQVLVSHVDPVVPERRREVLVSHPPFAHGQYPRRLLALELPESGLAHVQPDASGGVCPGGDHGVHQHVERHVPAVVGVEGREQQHKLLRGNACREVVAEHLHRAVAQEATLRVRVATQKAQAAVGLYGCEEFGVEGGLKAPRTGGEHLCKHGHVQRPRVPRVQHLRHQVQLPRAHLGVVRPQDLNKALSSDRADVLGVEEARDARSVGGAESVVNLVPDGIHGGPLRRVLRRRRPKQVKGKGVFEFNERDLTIAFDVQIFHDHFQPSVGELHAKPLEALCELPIRQEPTRVFVELGKNRLRTEAEVDHVLPNHGEDLVHHFALPLHSQAVLLRLLHLHLVHLLEPHLRFRAHSFGPVVHGGHFVGGLQASLVVVV